MSNLKFATKTLLILFFCLTAKISIANINAIELDKVNYPKTLQADIDFLVSNQSFYNHWSHTWTYKISKAKTIERLSALYAALDKLPAKNTEANLLMGDVAHYLYNMEAEAFYQKALDHYEAAKALSPNDYRVYWFLGNHYSLSAMANQGMDNYHLAIRHQPPVTHALFWADYAVACSTAGMPATALYAAEKSTSVAAQTSYIETQLQMFKKGILHAPPADTTIKVPDMWFGYNGNKSRHDYINWALGTKLTLDSTWAFQPNEFTGGQAYSIITPPTVKTQSGKTIGYHIMMFTRIAKANESLSQFLDLFTAKLGTRKLINLPVGNIKNTIAYELLVPEMYPQIGGGHMYALAFERDKPAYPGMVMEQPFEIPKSTDGKPAYYMSPRKFSRFNGKMYYMIMLDSCEFINKESLVALKDFLDNGVIVE